MRRRRQKEPAPISFRESIELEYDTNWSDVKTSPKLRQGKSPTRIRQPDSIDNIARHSTSDFENVVGSRNLARVHSVGSTFSNNASQSSANQTNANQRAIDRITSRERDVLLRRQELKEQIREQNYETELPSSLQFVTPSREKSGGMASASGFSPSRPSPSNSRFVQDSYKKETIVNGTQLSYKEESQKYHSPGHGQDDSFVIGHETFGPYSPRGSHLVSGPKSCPHSPRSGPHSPRGSVHHALHHLSRPSSPQSYASRRAARSLSPRGKSPGSGRSGASIVNPRLSQRRVSLQDRGISPVSPIRDHEAAVAAELAEERQKPKDTSKMLMKPTLELEEMARYDGQRRRTESAMEAIDDRSQSPSRTSLHERSQSPAPTKLDASTQSPTRSNARDRSSSPSPTQVRNRSQSPSRNRSPDQSPLDKSQSPSQSQLDDRPVRDRSVSPTVRSKVRDRSPSPSRSMATNPHLVEKDTSQSPSRSIAAPGTPSISQESINTKLSPTHKWEVSLRWSDSIAMPRRLGRDDHLSFANERRK